ncbi:DUF1648 domain-containing protein [Paenibacillus cookii]|uniref:Membrane protein n=1 Tax=Paenibacillus cookii TaxID=157839 RepID=A0ABQ4LWU0_9BACL|nr:DUF5808 domain-containing protein [Paenibacillus cookii]KHF36932.1 hypothetical protein CM49_00859 [Paenibacillus sp. P1XP2]GIO67745.1 membrane protein [Paenibacillus cookii]
MYWISAFMIVALFIPIIIALISIPFLSRETVSFGVSVSEEMYHSPQLRRMRQQFAWISGTLYALLLLGCLYSLMNAGEEGQATVISIFITAVIICSAAMNFAFYLRMKKTKASLPTAAQQSGKIAIDTRFRSKKITVSNRWFILHIAVMLISAILAIAYYDQFPETIAMKYDWHGEVTRSVDKSLQAVLGPNLMQLVMIFLFMFMNWMILKSKQQIHPDHPELSAQRNALFRLRWSMFNVVSGMLITLLLSFIQLNMRYNLPGNVVFPITMMMPAIIIVMALILSFTTGQGGRRIGRPSGAASATAVNDDRFWKLGFIYYNPNDPAMFVEKRMGIGWTINFARPAAWMIFAGILLLIFAAGYFAG